MAQGIEDGYLAACEIQKGRVNIDDTGITLGDLLDRKPIDANTGLPITIGELRARYEKTDYEDSYFASGIDKIYPESSHTTQLSLDSYSLSGMIA